MQGKAQDFLGSEMKQPLTVDAPSLKQRRRPGNVAQHRVGFDSKPFGDTGGDGLGTDDLQAQTGRQSGCHIRSL